MNGALEEALGSGSIFVYAILFGSGVVASFTPCTYPVLPLTVGYIGNASQGKKLSAFLMSLALVVGMALVYATLGIIMAAAGTPFGSLMGNGWFLFAIALFFVLLSLFLMDALTFPVPKFLQNMDAGQQTARRGIIGAFIVGGMSGLVVGPCTGPILAGVLAFVVTSLDEASGWAYAWQVIGGGAKLFVFGLGQGMLILLCGTFAGLLSLLPKSGKWMVYVKKGFALAMLLMACLMFVYIGQNTNFPQLSRVLAGAETSETETGPAADEDEPPADFGGEQFLD